MLDKKLINRLLISALLAVVMVCASCAADDDDDAGDDDDADDDADDDDDIPPGDEPQLQDADYEFGPAQCKCPFDADIRDGLVTITFNAEGLSGISAPALAAALDDYAPDVVALQGVPSQAAADELAGELQMSNALFSNDAAGLAVLSNLPLALVGVVPLDSGSSALKATLDFNGHILTLYNFALAAGAAGAHDVNDLQQSLDDEQSPLLILAGDLGGAEVYTTQMEVLQPRLADGFASLGIFPGQEHTVPATGWFGADGPHLSDSVLFDRRSGICGRSGGVITLSPAGSGHKPAWIELALPPEFGAPQPRALGTLAIFGPRRIEVLFDDRLDPQTLDGVTVKYSGHTLEPTGVTLAGNGSRLRIDLAEDLSVGQRYTVDLGGLLGLNGLEALGDEGLSFVCLENLLSNPGAEQGLAGWTVEGDGRDEAARQGIEPYSGARMFAGSPTEAVSSFSQTLSLAEHAPIIDSGNARLVFGAVTISAANYNGSATLPTARDEAEMLVEIYSDSGVLMALQTSGKWYTARWHPFLRSIELPGGSRRATLRLLLYGNSGNGAGNDALFDVAFLGLGGRENDLPRVSPNLLSNPLWLQGEGGQAGWEFKLAEVLASMSRGGGAEDESSYGGPRLAALGTDLGSGTIEQTVSVEGWDELIDGDEICLEWSGWARSWDGRSRLYPTLEFLDEDGDVLGDMTAAWIRDTQWREFSTLLRLAPGVRKLRYSVEGLSAAGEPAYLCLPNLQLRHTDVPGICTAE